MQHPPQVKTWTTSWQGKPVSMLLRGGGHSHLLRRFRRIRMFWWSSTSIGCPWPRDSIPSQSGFWLQIRTLLKTVHSATLVVFPLSQSHPGLGPQHSLPSSCRTWVPLNCLTVTLELIRWWLTWVCDSLLPELQWQLIAVDHRLVLAIDFLPLKC